MSRFRLEQRHIRKMLRKRCAVSGLVSEAFTPVNADVWHDGSNKLAACKK